MCNVDDVLQTVVGTFVRNYYKNERDIQIIIKYITIIII